ncbi:Hsp20/alpha crystallin family protein [Candidatus Giovannonibacteria bacterium]|nr:Hsp20/alpha crystallin family protein [Candidatus Giovannonibacteria bacterium]
MKIIRKNEENKRSDEQAMRPLQKRHLISPWRTFDRFFEDPFWESDFPVLSLKPFRSMGFPKVDVSETENEIKIVANVPGIDPEKIEIEIDDDTITLSGKIEKETEKKDEKVYRYEREYGEFRREFALPARVKTDQVQAKCKDGVLTITLPKTEEEKRKKIKIEKE